MSAMKELYLKVAADAGLQDKFAKIVAETGSDQEAQGKKLVEFGKELGYEITVAEIAEFFEAQAAKSGELAEEELDAVAGGKLQPGFPGPGTSGIITIGGPGCGGIGVPVSGTGLLFGCGKVVF